MFKRLFLLSCLGLIWDAPVARAGTLAQFRTVLGDIEIELYDQDKPVTVQNFIRYVQSGRYQNEFAHRLVPGFVIQGGGFTITNRGTAIWDIVDIPTYPAITNEFAIGPKYSNVFGTIAMAKASDPNSATSQFFFNLANNSASLDDTNNSGGFTVFGHLLRGTNVLNFLSAFQYWNGTQSSNVVLHNYYAPPFNDLPLRQPFVMDTNFIFMDITLLNVQVSLRSGGAREISWDSVSNKLNYVEYTTNFPPQWITLVTTNGTGSQIKVQDASTTENRRFYRVRVVY
jgi:peptidyl-prolyl cis-trans isomerase A (cyclophilin A)